MELSMEQLKNVLNIIKIRKQKLITSTCYWLDENKTLKIELVLNIIRHFV